MLWLHVKQKEGCMTNPFDRFTSRLEGIRPVPSIPGKTIRAARAYCPNHQRPPHRPGRGRTLSVAESNDGTLLIHCHASCSVEEVASAAGLEVCDLFASDEIQIVGSSGIGTKWQSSASATDAVVEAGHFLAAVSLSDHPSFDEIILAHTALMSRCNDLLSAIRLAMSAPVRRAKK
jgi:hypothetical protein